MTDRREFTALFLSMFKIFHKKNYNAVKLDRSVGVGWEGLIEKITFEQRCEGSEEISQTALWGKS